MRLRPTLAAGCARVVQSQSRRPNGVLDRDRYLAAAARLGVAPAECVVIEDAPAGLAAAHAAGMRAIGVAQTYPTAALRSADYVVSGLAALQIRHEPRRDELEVALAALGKA
jgi:mannitol-1-/sugar-/sorbitol-6-phosphatase